ncbi:MAG: hypothetical protein AAGC70_07960 [Pseudomonadota bacterium]
MVAQRCHFRSQSEERGVQWVTISPRRRRSIALIESEIDVVLSRIEIAGPDGVVRLGSQGQRAVLRRRIGTKRSR